MPNRPTPAEECLTAPEAKKSTPRRVDRRVDRRVAELATVEDGVLDVAELRACGLSDGAIAVRVARGSLHRLHCAVYAVGHRALTPLRRCRAALKACGPSAVLSHRSAAMLWGLMPWSNGVPEVTVAGAFCRRHAGIRVRRSQRLPPSAVTVHRGLAVTTVERTILDLASVLPPRQLRRVVRQALADERKTTIRALAAIVAENRGRRGVARLAAVLADAEPTESELEDVVLDLILIGGLAQPVVNGTLVLEGRKVRPDFRWPEQRLVVEADSKRWHDDPISRADDRERQQLLERHGDRVERVNWTQATRDGGVTLERLRKAGAPPNPRRGVPDCA